MLTPLLFLNTTVIYQVLITPSSVEQIYFLINCFLSFSAMGVVPTTTTGGALFLHSRDGTAGTVHSYYYNYFQ